MRTRLREAAWIAGRSTLRHRACRWDIAVLYRAHYVTRTLEEVFRKRELPYTIYSGAQFLTARRSRMPVLPAHDRLQDDLSFARIANVPRRIWGKRMRFLKEYAAQNDCSLYRPAAQPGARAFRSSGVAVFA